jgi:hypothetical protein
VAHIIIYIDMISPTGSLVYTVFDYVRLVSGKQNAMYFHKIRRALLF